MTTYSTLTVDPAKLRFRWQEQYVSEAHNRSMLHAPPGVYRGFEPTQSTIADTNVHLAVSPTHGDSFLVSADGPVTGTFQPDFKVVYRETADVVVPMGTLLPNLGGTPKLAVLIFVPAYVVSGATTGQFLVVDIADIATYPTGYCLMAFMNIPPGASTVTDAMILSDPRGGKVKTRPWDMPTGTSLPAVDSPPYASFANPYLMADLYAMRNMTLQFAYDGGYNTATFGTPWSSLTHPGAGRTIQKSVGPMTVVEAANIALGANFVAHGPPGAYLADGLDPLGGTAPNPDVGYDARTQVQSASPNDDFPRFRGRSWFDAPETGRSAFTNLNPTNTVLLSGPNNVSAVAPALFGDPGTFTTDLMPGDIMEIVSADNGHTADGFYEISKVLGNPAGLAVFVRGQSFTWSGLGVLGHTATVRIWKTYFRAGSTPKAVSSGGDGASAIVRGHPNDTALKIYAGDSSMALEVLTGYGTSVASYHQALFQVTFQGIVYGKAIQTTDYVTTTRYLFNTTQYRYRRIDLSEFQDYDRFVGGKTRVQWTNNGGEGCLSASGSAAGNAAYLRATVRVPLGVIIDTLYVIHSEDTTAVDAHKCEVEFFERYDDTVHYQKNSIAANTALNASGSASVPAMDQLSISYLDDQTGVDPTVLTWKFYEVRWQWNHGNNASLELAYFGGMILKYHYTSSGVVEPT